jgi:uncharacterized protein YcaQ
MTNLHQLRLQAISQSLLPPTTLLAALHGLGFVQADPIRSPARAQDLILRQRVRGYRAGDLERLYPSLDIEEDVLYAYGFIPRSVWQWIHPRNKNGLTPFQRKVFDLVRGIGPTHPSELQAHLGHRRITNAWGGYSKATTGALEDLHYRGLLRVARRDRGIRIYECAPPFDSQAPAAERLRQLVMLMARVLSPVPEKTLHANISRYRRLGRTRDTVSDLVRKGELRREAVEGLTYLWPAGEDVLEQPPPRHVRFLAPFDPVVWDRQRFEHLWGWPYRFEAYTPPALRVRGYYAMPLLWRDHIVGWANAKVVEGRLNVQVGFVGKPPKERDFNVELDAEISRMEAFLGRRKEPGAEL